MSDKTQVTPEDAKTLFDLGVIDEPTQEVEVAQQDVESEAPTEPVVESPDASQEEVAAEQVESTEADVSAEDFFISDSGLSEDGVIVEEPKVEEKQKTEKKKILVPFVNAQQKAIYNAMKQNPDVDITEVGMLFNKGYEKMSVDQLIRTDIVNDPLHANLNLTQKNIDLLYKKRINEVLSTLDPDNDEDYEERKDLLLAIEVNRIKMVLDGKREKMVEALSQDVEFEAEVDAPEQISEEELALERENLIKSYSETFEPMLKSGILKIKDRGDSVINVPIANKAKIAEAAADPVAFLKGLILNDSGEVNFQKFIGVVNYALNPSAYNATLISHGISQGKGVLMKEIKNTKVPDSRPSDSGFQNSRKMETIEDLRESFKAKFGSR